MDAKDKLRIANQFIGFGDPKATVWFMGNEEKLNDESLWDDNNIMKYKDITYSEIIDITKSKPQSTWGGYSKILKTLFPKEYKYFITNLWGIPKKNSSGGFDSTQMHLFEIEESDNKKEFYNRIKEERFNSLQVFFKTFNWKEKTIFFCTGSKYESEFNDFIKRLIFDENFSFNVSYEEVGVSDVFKKIFWTKHASYNQINDENIEFIREKIENN